MKRLKKMLLVAGCAAALGLTSGNLMAQGRNFDPAQFRQNVIDRMREQMDVKDDSEWNVIADAIGKVFDARMEVGMPRMGFRGPRNNGGGDNNNGDQGGQRRRGFFGQSPEAEDLQKSIDAKAPADEIKTKLAKLREATKAREAKLEKAQEDLKKLLTSRQEAVAVLAGLVK